MISRIRQRIRQMPAIGWLLMVFVLAIMLILWGAFCNGKNNNNDNPSSSPSPSPENVSPQSDQQTPRHFTVTVIAEANAVATASCPNGARVEATGYGKAEVTVSADTYVETYQRALNEAQRQAQEQANASAKANVVCTAPPALPPPMPIPSHPPITPAPPPPPTQSPTPPPTTPPTPLPPPTQPPTPPPTPKPTLFVSLTAEPNTGYAPLLAVTPVVTVGGTATGPITYAMDCGNGTMKRTVITGDTTYRFERLCDYLLPGEYKIIIQVSRMHLRVGGVATVVIAP